MLMHVDMVYHYPIWMVGLLVVCLASGGAVAVELLARAVIPLQARREANDVAASMFSVIGVLFAVLLAFVVMLTYEGYAGARVATASEAVAAQEVADAASGLNEPARDGMARSLAAYLDAVIGREWPAQAAGREDRSGAAALASMVAVASRYQPASAAEGDEHAALLAALARLRDARATRQVAASSVVPPVVWAVMLMGGALTVLAGSFVAAPDVRAHLIMSATLAASGAIVVVMVLALAQPFRGDIRVSPAPFEQVRASLAGAGR